jgi:hypothetical protein
MHDVLSNEQVWAVWERGQGENRAERALTLLAAADPDRARDDLAALTLGEREILLAKVRSARFGAQLRAVDRCPACGGEVEFELDLAEIFARQPEAPCRDAEHEWSRGDVRVRFRLLTSDDVGAVADRADGRQARAALLDRCILQIERGGEPMPVSSLPDEWVAALGEHVGHCDPRAETSVVLRCPCCAHAWSVALDMTSLLWEDVDRLARELLAEVHALARAYGWSERDVLALPKARRRAYLAMVEP